MPTPDTRDMPIQPEMHLHSESGVRLDGTPFVKLTWGVMQGIQDPETARDHALGVLVAAEAAIHDAAVYRFFVERLETEPGVAAQILSDLRQFRVDMREASDG